MCLEDDAKTRGGQCGHVSFQVFFLFLFFSDFVYSKTFVYQWCPVEGAVVTELLVGKEQMAHLQMPKCGYHVFLL